MKKIIILIIFLIAFFFNFNTVKAESVRCEWYSPITFVDNKNLLSGVYLQIPARYSGSNNFIAGTLDELTNSDGTGTIAGRRGLVNELRMKSTSSENIYFGFGNVYDYSSALLDLYIDDKIDYETEGYDLTDGCVADYLKVTCDPSTKKCKLVISNATEYENYLKNQFSFLNSDEKMIYNVYNIFLEDEDDVPNEYYNYLSHSTIFRLKNVSYPYPKVNLKKFQEYNNTERKGKEGLSEEEQASALSGLSRFIDTSFKNFRTIDSRYYDLTKDRMIEIYKTEKAGGKLSGEKKNIFNKWFYYTGRYIFENDLPLFNDIIEFMYSNGDVESITEDEYNNLKSMINEFIGAKDDEKSMETLKYDSCVAFCPSCVQNTQYNGNACTECKKNTEYVNCDKCYKQCSSALGDNKEPCVKGCLGNISYNKIEAYKNKLQSDFENHIDNMGKYALKLYNVTSSKAQSIELDFVTEKIDCDDISVLHSIYVAMIIIAPILVILMSTIDLTLAIVQSDPKKMAKFKQKALKRILILLLLILIPVVVRLIVNSIGGLDGSLISCVVNGN